MQAKFRALASCQAALQALYSVVSLHHVELFTCTFSPSCSGEMLVENLLDPAHVPFAHHGIQVLQSSDCIVPLGNLSSFNEPP